MLEYWNNLSGTKKLYLVLKLLAVLLFLIFVVRNWQSTEVILVFFKFKMPLTLVMLLSACIGAFIISIWFFRKLNEKNNQIKKLEEKEGN